MGKTALVTGGTRGIGHAISVYLKDKGFNVAANFGGNEEAAKAFTEETGIKTYKFDVSDFDAVGEGLKAIEADLGPVEVLVNNAGHFLPGSMHDEDDRVMEDQMATNFFSTYYLSKGLLPEMIEAGTGTIVNMCSIASITAYDAGGAYSVSKHAQYGFHKSLREEMKPKGIRVVAILPGAVYTSSWDGSGVPAERMMPAEDIAEITYSAVLLSARTVVEDIVLRPQLGDLLVNKDLTK